MHVCHFILGKASKDRANGVNQVIAGLAKYSARLGAEVRVIGKAQSVAHEGEIIDRDGFSVEAYSRWGRSLRNALERAITQSDIVHLHGTYSPWNLLVAGMCAKLDRPYVVTLHDGLAPERAIARSRIRKWVFHHLLQRRHLERAAAIHVIAEEEATDLYASARPKAVFCIPNGIDLEDYPPFSSQTKPSAEGVTIGYLGRLSPEKNLEALCQAFTKVNVDGNMRLTLAGPQSSYADNLLNHYAGHGVEWVGPKYGREKLDFIRSLDLFVLPSLCEVFSISAMEVMALGTPLLITRTAKASYFYDRGAFFMCEPSAFGLERGIQTAQHRRADWPAMTGNARRLIEERLNWRCAASDMLQAYEHILSARK